MDDHSGGTLVSNYSPLADGDVMRPWRNRPAFDRGQISAAVFGYVFSLGLLAVAHALAYQVVAFALGLVFAGVLAHVLIQVRRDRSPHRHGPAPLTLE